MTTTYELYTNENGTPKAVEGKAPAILERVETLETSVETLETSVETLETSVETLETSVETLETNVESLEGTLDNGVVTSVNGNTGDVTPEQTGCLPNSGGTIRGDVVSASNMVYRVATNDTRMLICGGTSDTNGALLSLSGKDRSGNNGMFTISARDGTNIKNLSGKPDGTLVWGDDNIITSAGGTFTESLNFSVPAVINQTTATSYTIIRGGTSNSDGARMVLCSKGDSESGQFKLYAHDGTNSKALIGKPDGTLTWNGKDLTSGGGSVKRGDVVNFSRVKTYTAPSNGIIYIEGDIAGPLGYNPVYGYFYIGSTYIGNSKATETNHIENASSDEPSSTYYIVSRAFFVNEGDVVTCRFKQSTASKYNMYFTGSFTPVNIG